MFFWQRYYYSSAHYTLNYPQSSTSCHDIRLSRGWGRGAGGWRCHDTLSTLVITPSPREERRRGLRVGVIEEVALTYVRWTRSCPYRSRYPRGSDWFGNSSLCWHLQRNRRRSLWLMAVTTCSEICWQQFKWKTPQKLPISWSWNWELKGIVHPKLQFDPFTTHPSIKRFSDFLMHSTVLEPHRGKEFHPCPSENSTSPYGSCGFKCPEDAEVQFDWKRQH